MFYMALLVLRILDAANPIGYMLQIVDAKLKVSVAREK